MYMEYVAPIVEAIPPITDERLLQDVSSLPVEAIEGFREHCEVSDSNFADEVVKRVAQMRAKKEHILNLYVWQREQLERYKDEEVSRIDRNERFWTDRLEEYFLYLRTKGIVNDGDNGINLPHGRLQSRKVPASWNFDEVNLNELQRIDPNMVKVSASVDKKYAKTHLYAHDGGAIDPKTKKVISGIKTTENGKRFYIDIPRQEG